jgi:hypothetical protein
MIAVFAVLAALALNYGWSRNRTGFWRHMRWKWLATTLLMVLLALTAAPLDGITGAAILIVTFAIATFATILAATLPMYCLGRLLKFFPGDQQ